MSQEAECPVLLIEDEADAAKLIQYVLSKGTAPKLAVDWASDLHSGLDRLAERPFEAVLLDLNLPDSSGFDTFARVRQNTGSALIVLTAQEDEALALQAVRAGADEYLIKSDIRDRFLAQRIRYAIERKRRSHQNGAKPVHNGRIFGFIGAKGGAGTTTLVLNLAAALAKAGKSAIALELSPAYGSFAASLRHVPLWNSSTLLKTAPEVITREQLESCLAEVGCGFRALFGPQRPEDYTELTPGHARALLRNSATLADYTLVDLPSSFGPYTPEVVQHAAFLALVVERDWLGLHAASAKLPLLKASGMRDQACGLVLIDRSPHAEILPVQDFAARLNSKVMGVIPAAGDQLAANHSTVPLVFSRPDAAFSEAIFEIATRFCAAPVLPVRF
jgi:Flp pilus assembly CpaE family ATPase